MMGGAVKICEIIQAACKQRNLIIDFGCNKTANRTYNDDFFRSQHEHLDNKEKKNLTFLEFKDIYQILFRIPDRSGIDQIP